eukprot:Nk52_evm11s274 gene=Nk52_evmTU11s274
MDQFIAQHAVQDTSSATHNVFGTRNAKIRVVDGQDINTFYTLYSLVHQDLKFSISEKPKDVFKLFFDIDSGSAEAFCDIKVVDYFVHDLIPEYVRLFFAHGQKTTLYVAKNPDDDNVHVICDNIIVDVETALEFRNYVILNLCEKTNNELSLNECKKFIDGSVYKSGLRMLGCPKFTKPERFPVHVGAVALDRGYYPLKEGTRVMDRQLERSVTKESLVNFSINCPGKAKKTKVELKAAELKEVSKSLSMVEMEYQMNDKDFEKCVIEYVEKKTGQKMVARSTNRGTIYRSDYKEGDKICFDSDGNTFAHKSTNGFQAFKEHDGGYYYCFSDTCSKKVKMFSIKPDDHFCIEKALALALALQDKDSYYYYMSNYYTAISGLDSIWGYKACQSYYCYLVLDRKLQPVGSRYEGPLFSFHYYCHSIPDLWNLG